MEWRGTGNKRALKTIKDTYVYIPILETLENFLNPRSKLSSIRLMAITYRSHIKKYGMNAILQPIVDDVKKLVS